MKQSKDLPTKEKILEVSIGLFSQKGFKEVTVREIAEAVGIKASSLYKHYESKEDILGSIFSLFKEKIAQTTFAQPEIRQYINAVSPARYLDEAFARFRQVMWEPTAVKIARIITLEQQQDPSIRQFFIEEFVEKPHQALKQALDLMAENGSIDSTDTRVLAEEYNAYILYLYFEQNFLKESPDLEEIERKMRQHNDFYAHRVLKKEED